MTETDRCVRASVRAPQGGPTYIHAFESPTVADALRRMADSLDLERADRVDIAIEFSDEPYRRPLKAPDVCCCDEFKQAYPTAYKLACNIHRHEITGEKAA